MTVRVMFPGKNDKFVPNKAKHCSHLVTSITYARRVLIYPMEWKRLFTLTTHHPLWVPGLSQLQSNTLFFFFSHLTANPPWSSLGFFSFSPIFFLIFFFLPWSLWHGIDIHTNTSFQWGGGRGHSDWNHDPKDVANETFVVFLFFFAFLHSCTIYLYILRLVF